jgi:hypothetical protein
MSEIPRANVIDIAIDTIKAAFIIVFSYIWLTSDFVLGTGFIALKTFIVWLSNLSI